MGTARGYSCPKCGYSLHIVGREGYDCGFSALCQVRCAECRNIEVFRGSTRRWGEEFEEYERRCDADNFSTSEQRDEAFANFVKKILPNDAKCSRCGGSTFKPLGDLEKLPKPNDRFANGAEPYFEFLQCPDCDGKMERTTSFAWWD